MKKRQVLIFVAAILFSNATLACPFHMNMEYDDNSPVLPGTMQLTLAGMYAEQTGMISPVAELKGLPAFQRASWWLTLFSRSLKEQGVEGVHIVLTDVPLWSSYGIENEGKLEIDILPPKEHANTIMLTHVSLQAIIDGTLTLQEAFENNIILIHRDNMKIKEKLINS